jgi:hypothetical protein
MSKYKNLPDNYFGFDLFEEIFDKINLQKNISGEASFRAGVASAEAAVRRLRESYYKTIKNQLDEQE